MKRLLLPAFAALALSSSAYDDGLIATADGVMYRTQTEEGFVYVFTDSATVTPRMDITLKRAFLVGGGGAGGMFHGGGGGGGGVVDQDFGDGLVCSTSDRLLVEVGKGGDPQESLVSQWINGLSGGDSRLLVGGAEYRALGGGGGGGRSNSDVTLRNGADGGCGGGAARKGVAGAGSQGGNGGTDTTEWSAGGGGGAKPEDGGSYDADAVAAGKGGEGFGSAITGEPRVYGSGGGGGGTSSAYAYKAPGLGGTGAGKGGDNARGENGTNGLGAGGGGGFGAGGAVALGGWGGSGTVILVVKVPDRIAVSVLNYSGVYDGFAHSATAIVSYPTSGASVKWSLSESGPFENDEPPAWTEVGEYACWCRASAVDYDPVTLKATVSILGKPITKDMIEPVEDAVYTGSAIEPRPVVTDPDSGMPISEGVGIRYEYADNVSIGVARVRIVGIGMYDSFVDVYYNIAPAEPLSGDVYVDAQGSGDGSGTGSDAIRSVETAVKFAANGATIHIAQGTYALKMGITSSGRSFTVDCAEGVVFDAAAVGQVFNLTGKSAAEKLVIVGATVAGVTNASEVVDVNGGGAYLKWVRMEGCSFLNCAVYSSAKVARGGAVYAAGPVEFIACRFAGNSALGSSSAVGGAIYMDAADASIVSNCLFESNSSDGSCGAICWFSGSNGEIVYSTFTNNCSASSQGAVYVRFCAQVRGCRFVDNRTTSGSGGALYYQNAGGGSRTSVLDCLFEGNFAGGNGGALATDSGNQKFYLERCYFHDNEAGGAGGGACIPMKLSMVCDSVFSDNISTGDGAAMSFSNSGNVRNCLVMENSGACALAIGYGSFSIVPEEDENATHLTSCTFVGNTVRNVSKSLVQINGNYGNYICCPTYIRNCLFAENDGANVTFPVFADGYYQRGAENVQTCFSDLEQTCFFAFEEPVRGNIYDGRSPFTAGSNLELRVGSPCIDAGDNQDWMLTARGISREVPLVSAVGDYGVALSFDNGRPRKRIVGKAVDIGCYESKWSGLVLFVR